MCPYLQEVKRSLPRILALFDTDPLSSSFGLGDRRYWAWCLMDFGNGTYQGVVNGLSILLESGLLPEEFSSSLMSERIEYIIRGTSKLIRSDGSLEEAFPFEGSFCVTALVAYDFISALELVGDTYHETKRKEFISIVEPMIHFLLKADETHAIISNHLATALAALVKWEDLTGQSVFKRAKQLRDRIIENQSSEGWFSEYGGFDPGYQSLCTYYLAEASRVSPQLELLEPLRKSIKFLWHFAHPDGSFGGYYGSRNTRFFYPGGLEALATEIPEAASLASFMRESIKKQRVVTLASIDEPNLIPTFNSYCLAASLSKVPVKKALPIFRQNFQINFPYAGLIIDHGTRHHTIVSTNKGGVVYHFIDKKLKIINTGLAARSTSGRYYSTQTLDPSNLVGLKDGVISIDCKFLPVLRKLPTPFQFMGLRFLNLTIMRIYKLREWIKQILVKYLITGKGKVIGRNYRKIKLGEDLRIDDTPILPSHLKKVELDKPFSSIHMASQGYWQVQDEQTPA